MRLKKWLSMFLVLCMMLNLIPLTALAEERYPINVVRSDHGVVTADKETAVQHERITLTVTPEEGYGPCEIIATYANDSRAHIYTVDANTYYFAMPDYDVDVITTFTPAHTVLVGSELPLAHGEIILDMGVKGGSNFDIIRDLPLSGTERTICEGQHAYVVVEPDKGYQIFSVFAAYVGTGARVYLDEYWHKDLQETEGEIIAPSGIGDYVVEINASFHYTPLSVNVSNAITNGSVTADIIHTGESNLYKQTPGTSSSAPLYDFPADMAAIGDTVNLHITPDEGYELNTLDLYDSYGYYVPVENNSFIMPGGSVTVNATFIRSGSHPITVAPILQNALSVSQATAYEGDKVYLSYSDDAHILDGVTLNIKDADDNPIAIETEDDGQSTRQYFIMPDSNVTITADIYNMNVSQTDGGTLTVDKSIAKPDETVTVTATPETGYVLSRLYYQVNDDARQYDISLTDGVYEYTFLAPSGGATVYAEFELEEAGTSQRPFRIHNKADWDAFAEKIAAGTDTEAYYILADDFDDSDPITTPVGTQAHPFAGHFNGNGKTLNVNISDNDYDHQGTAPFRYIAGAEICNLTVTGTVEGSTHAAGLAGINLSGTSSFTDVTIDVSVQNSFVGNYNSHISGVLGHNTSATINMENIVFSGTIQNSQDYAGGLIGWSDNSTVNLTNCLFNGSYTGSGTFHPILCKNGESTVTATADRVYYTATPQGILVNPQDESQEYYVDLGIWVTALLPENAIYRPYSAADGNTYYVYMEVKGPESCKYTGSEITPVFTVKNTDGTPLTEGVDYTISYDPSPIRDLGIYTATITGTGVYAGTYTGSFEVKNDYVISVAPNPVNGTVTVISSANEDDVVMVTLTPDELCELQSVSVCGDITGNNVPVQVSENVGTFVMPAENVTISAVFRSLWGTETYPFEIHSAADWDAFAAKIAAGTDTAAYYKLADDFAGSETITTPVGTQSHPFAGHFDGNGKTLNVSINDSSAQGTAPFRYIAGAEIHDLTVTGNVIGTTHAAGLVGFNWTGTSRITNVCVEANITNPASSGNRHIGGVVGHNKSAVLEMNDVIFSGTLQNSGSYVGGLVGWSDNSTVRLNNCLFKGNYIGSGEFHPVACKNIDASVTTTVSRVYYTQAPSNPLSGYTMTNHGIPVTVTPPADTLYKAVVPADNLTYYVATSATGYRSWYRFTGEEIVPELTITSDDGSVLTLGTDYTVSYDPAQVRDSGTYIATVTGTGDYSGSLTYHFTVSEGVPYVDANGVSQTPITDFIVVDDSLRNFDHQDSWYVVVGDVTLSGWPSVSSNVNLILADGATLTAPYGISVDESLTIWQQTEGTGRLIAEDISEIGHTAIGGYSTYLALDGSLTINGGTIIATGSSGKNNTTTYYGGSGIGVATLIINNGTIIATGGRNAAGIGGRENSFHVTNGKTVVINGGNVTAIGGLDGAGIGGGDNGSSGNITINGGNVIATGGPDGAGIGGGNYGNVDNIIINGGNVTATGGSSAAGIGGGHGGNGGNITISGGNVTATGGVPMVVGDPRICGIGPGEGNQLTASITLTWTDETADIMSVRANKYGGTVQLEKSFTDGADIYEPGTASNATIADKLLVPYKAPDPEPSFKTHTLLLSGQIGVNFYVDLSMLTEDQRRATTMSFTVGTRAAGTDTFDASCTNPKGDGYYGFTCFINSAQMSDTITATLHYGEGQTITKTTSVQGFVTYIVDPENGYNEKTVALAKAIADYGHYMTPFIKAEGTGVDTDTEIESYTNYSDEQINAAREAVASMAINKTDANGILTNTSFKLTLGSETAINLFFNAALTGTEQITVTQNGNPVSKALVDYDGTRYRVRIPNINAVSLDDEFTITVTDGDSQTATITVCALSYANTIFTGTRYQNNTGAINAMTSLYYYYLAAKNYIR